VIECDGEERFLGWMRPRRPSDVFQMVGSLSIVVIDDDGKSLTSSFTSPHLIEIVIAEEDLSFLCARHSGQ
jgi:hypothetical protein